MKTFNFDKDWRFCFENEMDGYNYFGLWKIEGGARACERFLDFNNWEKIDLPHDWAIALPIDKTANNLAGGRLNCRYNVQMNELLNEADKIYNVGWYRKHFEFDPKWNGKRIFIEFEGIYRDAVLWVNGTYIMRHTSGYTGFCVEITDYLYDGENSISVRVDTDQTEGWWYDGSGIYRHVFLHVCSPTYFKMNKTIIKTQTDGQVSVSCVVVNDENCSKNTDTLFGIYDKNGNCVAKSVVCAELDGNCEKQLNTTLKIHNPTLWDLDNPYLYTLVISVDGETQRTEFGVREIKFDPNLGFLLNGKRVKLRGASVHQDFGGVGVALSDNLNRYKIKKLKEMGCNAYRTAHNAPSPALLKACDEEGMFVMDEARMFGTSPEAIEELTALIERDRNHPSVIMWSLGNEENAIENVEYGARMMEKMTRIAKRLDDRPVTFGGNNGDNFVGVNLTSEVRGINYIHGKGSRGEYPTWVDKYHADHPHQPIVGTEETSNFSSRGGMINDLDNLLLDCTGQMCAAWGTTPRGFVKFSEERDYYSGGFMWTGFDYRGEPTPFNNTNVVSTFGAIDLCGMEKPPFYYYKAWWTDEPVLKLLPHWNYKSGEKAKVVVMTNCEHITLKLNGKIIEERKVEKFDEPIFELDYKKGVLEVVGTKNGNTYTDKLETSGKTNKIRTDLVLSAKTEDDIAIYELTGWDNNGRFCPLADETVEVTVRNGEIVGVGNGDPASYEIEQKMAREEAVYITSITGDGGEIPVPPKYSNVRKFRKTAIIREDEMQGYTDGVRLIVRTVNPSIKAVETYYFKVSDVHNFEYVEFERLGGKARVYLNGKEIGNNLRSCVYADSSQSRPYRFYAKLRKGENEVKVVSERNEQSPPAVSGYIKIGRTVKDNTYQVRLHYGRARVFVRSKTPDKVKLSAKIKR
ncbi:MAG: DUF4982 domain-containing protein [Clostridia bacterium]|nr:DUF4982 domain-containing protein [Clostridia bacterium]